MSAGALQRVTYAPRGDAIKLLESQDDEVLLEGPVGTGKSYSLVWKAHLLCLMVPGVKGLFLRKTLASLTASAVATYTQKVLTTANYGVKFFGGSLDRPPGFTYPNGSRILLGGMVEPGRIMSQEFDFACVFEATELTLNEWERVTTRLRNNVLGYQQVMADCNPDVPTHWLNQRCSAGLTRRLLSRHPDNPTLWDPAANDGAGDWTEAGRAYVVEKLGKLTGVRRKRLLDGIWAAAEGQVFEQWDPAIHVVDRFEIPASWPRYWVIDWGYQHPFVWQWWAESPDGALVRYREIYFTGRIVTDHVALGLRLSADEPRPSEIIVDHDAEDRATFERATGYDTTPANKAVSPGIQAVEARMRRQGPNDLPRLFFLRDSLVERDEDLAARGQPTCTEEEFPSYVWNLAAGRNRGEEPVKQFDHGMDCCRYLVAFKDLDDGTGSVVTVSSYMERLYR